MLEEKGLFWESFTPQIRRTSSRDLHRFRSSVPHIQNIFIDPIVSARKKAEKRDRHEERWDWWWRWRRNVSFFLSLSLFMSISLLRLFSRAHYWVNKYILKMRVSSKELFSTLKNLAFHVEEDTVFFWGAFVCEWMAHRKIEGCTRRSKIEFLCSWTTCLLSKPRPSDQKHREHTCLLPAWNFELKFQRSKSESLGLRLGERERLILATWPTFSNMTKDSHLT